MYFFQNQHFDLFVHQIFQTFDQSIYQGSPDWLNFDLSQPACICLQRHMLSRSSFVFILPYLDLPPYRRDYKGLFCLMIRRLITFYTTTLLLLVKGRF